MIPHPYTLDTIREAAPRFIWLPEGKNGCIAKVVAGYTLEVGWFYTDGRTLVSVVAQCPGWSQGGTAYEPGLRQLQEMLRGALRHIDRHLEWRQRAMDDWRAQVERSMSLEPAVEVPWEG